MIEVRNATTGQPVFIDPRSVDLIEPHGKVCTRVYTRGGHSPIIELPYIELKTKLINSLDTKRPLPRTIK